MTRSFKALTVTALLVSTTACGGGDSDTAALEDRIAELESASTAPQAPPESPPAEPSDAASRPAPAPSEAEKVVDFAMPSLVGANLQDAQNAIQELGVFFSISHDMLGSRNQVLDSNWKVCNQTPAAGTQITGPASQFEGTIDFGAVKLTETCP